MIATTNYCDLQEGSKGRICFMLALFSYFTVSSPDNQNLKRNIKLIMHVYVC